MKLHHVGFATNDPKKYIDMFYKMNDTITIKKGIAEKYGASCVFIEGENFSIELITPTKKGNHLDKFIQKRGDSLHHIAIFGKGKYKGALNNMYVDFNKITKDNKLLIETVEVKDDM